ncbi:hypothetical protein ACXR0O_08215 [Verrucomicrobiota bacterium sgz303538]
MITSSCLWGTVVAEDEDDKELIERTVAALTPYCESYSWSDNGKWHFHADFALPEYAKLQEGELHDMMRSIYPTLLDLYNFYDAEFEMTIVLGESMGKAFTLQPHILAMCASLGMAIEFAVEHTEPEAPPNHGAHD